VNLFTDLANAIAPRVNPRAVRARSPEARLASRLFDYDLVTKRFLEDLSAEFYANTQPAWQWNSRYWAQVSLMYLAQYHAAPSTPAGKDAISHAVQHARHAIAIERHPIPLSTLGQVLLAAMNEKGWALGETYEEAFHHLVIAIELERSRVRANVHPFITLFRGTRDYVLAGGALSGFQADQLRLLAREANRKFASDSEIQEELRELSSILK
jgi:hypothetical protein